MKIASKINFLRKPAQSSRLIVLGGALLFMAWCSTSAFALALPDFESLVKNQGKAVVKISVTTCLLYTSPSPRDRTRSRMPSSA